MHIPTYWYHTPGVGEALQANRSKPYENSAEVLLIYGYSASGTTARSLEQEGITMVVVKEIGIENIRIRNLWGTQT